MMKVRVEIRNRCSWSESTYVAAIQPAKATAACPDGSPPRSGVPRPLTAFVPITMMITITSAISVIFAGASRRRSSNRSLRFATEPEKTRYPIATALMVAIRTAPAAMSFASFAIGSNSVVATSIAPSIAVFSISAISTNAIASSSAINSMRDTSDASPTISTTAATTKWIRMFRCVRRTWMIPSNA